MAYNEDHLLRVGHAKEVFDDLKEKNQEVAQTTIRVDANGKFYVIIEEEEE